MRMKENRREFIRKSAFAGVGILGMNLTGVSGAETQPEINKSKIPGNMRTGFIGVGSRGRSHVNDSLGIEGVDIVALCDIRQSAIDDTLRIISGKGKTQPKI